MYCAREYFTLAECDGLSGKSRLRYRQRRVSTPMHTLRRKPGLWGGSRLDLYLSIPREIAPSKQLIGVAWSGASAYGALYPLLQSLSYGVGLCTVLDCFTSHARDLVLLACT